MGMSGGFTEVDLVARQFEKVKHNSTKWMGIWALWIAGIPWPNFDKLH